MTFLDAWSLPPLDLVRILLPVIALAVPLVVPGARTAAVAAFAMAAVLVVSPLVDLPPGLRAGWIALWALLGLGLWRLPAAPPAGAGRGAGFEAAVIGLAVGGGLIAVMVFAIARQDMPPPITRRLTLALAVIGLGLLQLMLRRHIVRGASGFAALALGVQVLDSAALAAQLPGTPSSGATTLAAAALAAALTFRLGESRRRHASGPWVSDAHDLHD